MRIALVTKEFLGIGRKWTGVADAVHGLSRALVKRDHNVRVIMPLTDPNPMINNVVGQVGVNFEGRRISVDVIEYKPNRDFLPNIFMLRLPVAKVVDPLLSENEAQIERRLGLFFDQAAVALLQQISSEIDVVQAHTGVEFFAYFAKQRGIIQPIIYTLHHLEKGEALSVYGNEFHDLTGIPADQGEKIDPYVYAINSADRVIPVSERYAEELKRGQTLHTDYIPVIAANAAKISGILNGLQREFNPQALFESGLIPRPFSAEDLSGKAECHIRLQQQLGLPQDPNIPIMLWSQRPVPSKGFVEFAGGAFNQVMQNDMQLIVFARGERNLEDLLAAKAARFPHKIRIVRFNQFNQVFEPSFIAGADMVVMPALEEPGGLLALKAMRLGTLPLVRPVGGLAQIVQDDLNGFVIPDGVSIENELGKKMVEAMIMYTGERETWVEMQRNAMNRPSTWGPPSEKYLQVYRELLS